MKLPLLPAFFTTLSKTGGATRDDIVKEFGEEVAQLVDGVTKITQIRLRGSNEEEFVENLRKMILVMARDLRVVFVKLADRLHNMQTLQYLSPQKQTENAKETLEIYALSRALGHGRNQRPAGRPGISIPLSRRVHPA